MLEDGDEVSVHGTDPLQPDTDADGRTDFDEVAIDLTDPLDGGARIQPIRLTSPSFDAEQAAIARGPDGNLHLVWVDTRDGNSGEIYWSMIAPDGSALVDDTRLTSDPAKSKRPAVAVDPLGRVHVAWHDDRLGAANEIFYSRLDPSLHPQDGTSGVDATLALVDDLLISADDGTKGSHPEVITDATGAAWVAWQDDDGVAVLARQVQAGGGPGWGPVKIFEDLVIPQWRAHPRLALDGSGLLHVVWSAWTTADPTFYARIHYAAVDAASGGIVIGPTPVTPGPDRTLRHPSAGLLSDGQLAVPYQSTIEASTLPPGVISRGEVHLVRIDPALDDQDGDPADGDAIRTLAEIAVAPAEAEGEGAKHPLLVADPAGPLHIAYLADYQGPSNGDGRGNVALAVVDRDGVPLMPLQKLTVGETAITRPLFLRPFAAASGRTAWVVWSDDRFGSDEIVLMIVNPDTDGDGRTNLEEWEQGTDPVVPD